MLKFYDLVEKIKIIYLKNCPSVREERPLPSIRTWPCKLQPLKNSNKAFVLNNKSEGSQGPELSKYSNDIIFYF